jgi:protein-S-isoprenylcysteine O-methyltransferase
MLSLIPVFEGKVAFTSVLTSVATVVIMTTSGLSLSTMGIVEAVYILSLVLVMFSLPTVKVVLCSHLLGVVIAVGALMSWSSHPYSYFGFYAAALGFFHVSEYILTSIFNPHTLSMDSFLLNHSREYIAAAVASWVEYWAELYLFPNLKMSLHHASVIGCFMVIFGEALRKVAMITAGTNFTHLVQYRKRDGHELVTSGVYSMFRHPSYVGWFYWSIGTQVVLCNPVCLVGYSIASWMFFKERIEDEEESLVLFFGEKYIDFKKRVGTGIPFISGYPMDKAVALLQYRGR